MRARLRKRLRPGRDPARVGWRTAIARWAFTRDYWPELDELRDETARLMGRAPRAGAHVEAAGYFGLGIYLDPYRGDHESEEYTARLELARQARRAARRREESEREARARPPMLVYFAPAAWAANVAHNRALGIVEYPEPARTESQSPAPPIPAWATGLQWNADRGVWEYSRD
jgi:hypothetical protein